MGKEDGRQGQEDPGGEDVQPWGVQREGVRSGNAGMKERDQYELGVPAFGGRSTPAAGETPSLRLRPNAPAREPLWITAHRMHMRPGATEPGLTDVEERAFLQAKQDRINARRVRAELERQRLAKGRAPGSSRDDLARAHAVNAARVAHARRFRWAPRTVDQPRSNGPAYPAFHAADQRADRNVQMRAA